MLQSMSRTARGITAAAAAEAARCALQDHQGAAGRAAAQGVGGLGRQGLLDRNQRVRVELLVGAIFGACMHDGTCLPGVSSGAQIVGQARGRAWRLSLPSEGILMHTLQHQRGEVHITAPAAVASLSYHHCHGTHFVSGCSMYVVLRA